MSDRGGPRSRLVRSGVFVGLLALAIPGTTVAQSPATGPGGSAQADPSAAPAMLVTCGSRAYPGLGIDGPPVDPRADDPTSRALGDALERYRDAFPVAQDTAWRLAGVDEHGSLFLGRDERASDSGWVGVEVHEDEGRWRSNIGECDPRRVIAADIGVADWWLDPAFPAPWPDATELHVLVLERACASGQPPDGRIAEPVVDYAVGTVTITIGARRAEGDQDCPSNPAVPLTVLLSEPLGDRTLLDGSRLPPGPPLVPDQWLMGASPTPSASPAPRADTFGSWYQVTDDDESAATGLWVGRLGGQAFHVLDEPIVRADGPVGGRVLVWRSAEGQRTVSLVDTADGSEVEVLRTEDGGVPVLAPDGRTMYSIEVRDDEPGDVWRMRLPDGERELILEDRATRYSSLQLSTNGRYLALEAGMYGDARSVMVVDTRSGETWDVRTTGGGVVGFLGRHLVTYSEPEGDEARFPLLAVDPRDGSTRTVARAGIYPAIVPDADGRGVLVWRTFDDQSASIRVRDSVGGRRRTIHTVPRSEARARSSAVVRRGFDQGIEIPGYVALFPDGHAFAWPEVAQRYAGQSRTLVSIADGSVIELDAVEPSPAS